MIECPCYKCEAREIGCHGKCEAYISWTRNRINMQEKEKMNRRNVGNAIRCLEVKRSIAKRKAAKGGYNK